MHGGAGAGWAVGPEASAEGVHRVVEPDQPGSTAGLGAAATVVAHRDPQHRIAGVGVVGVERMSSSLPPVPPVLLSAP